MHCPGLLVRCIELQPGVHRAAQRLTAMAAAAGDVERSHVVHLVGDAVTGAVHAGDGGSEVRSSSGEEVLAIDGSVDAVMSRLCVLHIPLESRERMFSRACKWLRPGGVLAIEDYARLDSGLLPYASKALQEEVAVPEVPPEHRLCSFVLVVLVCARLCSFVIVCDRL